MIELSKLSKTYKVGGQEIHALKDVSLKVADGEFLVIVGPSGSGKSTLMHLMGGLDKPSSGAVSVDGSLIERLNDKQLSAYRNAKIGFVFQDFKLHPHLNILENVKIPLILNKEKKFARSTIRKKALAALKEVGLEKHANHRPDQISGGQKQRVAIARALVNNPSIILADEPLGDLDSVTGTMIINLLKDLHKKKRITFIVVTHDLSVAKHATRMVEIKDGVLKIRDLVSKRPGLTL